MFCLGEQQRDNAANVANREGGAGCVERDQSCQSSEQDRGAGEDGDKNKNKDPTCPVVVENNNNKICHPQEVWESKERGFWGEGPMGRVKMEVVLASTSGV